MRKRDEHDQMRTHPNWTGRTARCSSDVYGNGSHFEAAPPHRPGGRLALACLIGTVLLLLLAR